MENGLDAEMDEELYSKYEYRSFDYTGIDSGIKR